jgi:hypothetical protein
VSVERVAITPERWRCYLDRDAQPFFYRPECARREFDADD